MNKIVNIRATRPIVGTRYPIAEGLLEHVPMTIDEIRICICEHAIVEEVLSTGKTILLNMQNYNKVNTVESPLETTAKETIPEVKPVILHLNDSIKLGESVEVVSAPVEENVEETTEEVKEMEVEVTGGSVADVEPEAKEELKEAVSRPQPFNNKNRNNHGGKNKK